jgi:mono/diheme cytochrome c family protein
MALILGALLWILLSRTPAGTAQSQELVRVRPTQTALAAMYSGSPSGTETGAVAVVALPVTCAACHSIEGTDAAGKVCPDLTHIGSVSSERVASADYLGAASTIEEYIRESILDPNAYVVQGTGWVTPAGASIMPPTVGQALTPSEVDRLVSYLASLK